MTRGPLHDAIIAKLSEAFAPIHLEVENESRMHRGPADAETHFRVVIVSAAFEGVSRVARSRAAHAALKDELARGRVHALSLKTHSPSEWAEKGGRDDSASPPCAGKNK